MDIIIDEFNGLSIETSSDIKDSTNVIKIVAICGAPVFGTQKFRELILKEIESRKEIGIIELTQSEHSSDMLVHDLSNLKLECIDFNPPKEYYKNSDPILSDFKPEKPIIEDDISTLDRECTQYFRPIKTFSYKSTNIPKVHKFKARSNC